MGVPLDPVVNHNVSLLKLSSSSSSSSSSPALIISKPSFCNGKLKILETNEPSVSCGLLGKRRWPSDITTASRIGSMGGWSPARGSKMAEKLASGDLFPGPSSTCQLFTLKISNIPDYESRFGGLWLQNCGSVRNLGRSSLRLEPRVWKLVIQYVTKRLTNTYSPILPRLWHHNNDWAHTTSYTTEVWRLPKASSAPPRALCWPPL